MVRSWRKRKKKELTDIDIEIFNFIAETGSQSWSRLYNRFNQIYGMEKVNNSLKVLEWNKLIEYFYYPDTFLSVGYKLKAGVSKDVLLEPFSPNSIPDTDKFVYDFMKSSGSKHSLGELVEHFGDEVFASLDRLLKDKFVGTQEYQFFFVLEV